LSTTPTLNLTMEIPYSVFFEASTKTGSVVLTQRHRGAEIFCGVAA
jgi:hypothetical protein